MKIQIPYKLAGLAGVGLMLGLLFTACNKNNTPASTDSSSATSSSTPSSSAPSTSDNTVKRYSLKGKVVSIDEKGQMANVDGEAIPGFMDAMTMPYVVNPASELAQLQPGDSITADVVVQGDKNWLENVQVTASEAPMAMKPMKAMTPKHSTSAPASSKP